MVNRIQNRNPGYSEGIFAKKNLENNPINSINGATALKLDNEFELNPSNQNENLDKFETRHIEQPSKKDTGIISGSEGISIENASYIEDNLEIQNDTSTGNENLDEDAPQLFSSDNQDNFQSDQENSLDANQEGQKLFEENLTDEEEFEIPAFLRKQKF